MVKKVALLLTIIFIPTVSSANLVSINTTFSTTNVSDDLLGIGDGNLATINASIVLDLSTPEIPSSVGDPAVGIYDDAFRSATFQIGAHTLFYDFDAFSSPFAFAIGNSALDNFLTVNDQAAGSFIGGPFAGTNLSQATMSFGLEDPDGTVLSSDALISPDLVGWDLFTFQLTGGTSDGRFFNILAIQVDVPDFTVSPVPVPAAVWLFGTALIGLVGFSKRKVRIAA